MITDFQTKENRLKKPVKPKEDPSDHFNLADNDDFYGYSQSEGDRMTVEKAITYTGIVLLVLPFAYAIVWAFLALTPNF